MRDCRLFPDCQFWTFDPERDPQCQILYDDDKTSQASAGVTSGPRYCITPECADWGCTCQGLADHFLLSSEHRSETAGCAWGNSIALNWWCDNGCVNKEPGGFGSNPANFGKGCTDCSPWNCDCQAFSDLFGASGDNTGCADAGGQRWWDAMAATGRNGFAFDVTCYTAPSAPAPYPGCPAPTHSPTSAVYRTRLNGVGCHTLSRSACCGALDGRVGTIYGYQRCFPAVEGQSFSGGNDCEPENFIMVTGQAAIMFDCFTHSDRYALPDGTGCDDVTDRAECCAVHHITGERCMPSPPGQPFSGTSNVCHFLTVATFLFPDQTDWCPDHADPDGRFRLPTEVGCNTITDRAECCTKRDARAAFYREKCIPALPTLTFLGGAVCEPLKHITDSHQQDSADLNACPDLGNAATYSPTEVGGRRRLRPGVGCHTISDHAECCIRRDGRDAFLDQKCMPDNGEPFNGNNNCEPLGHIISSGQEGRMGSCPDSVPTASPSATVEWTEVSANRACQGNDCDPHFYSYLLPSVNPLPAGQGLSFCQQRCESTPNCQAINYFHQSRWCHLFSRRGCPVDSTCATHNGASYHESSVSDAPTAAPTRSPTAPAPTVSPTASTGAPTAPPTSSYPTAAPATGAPTASPTPVTESPTDAPTTGSPTDGPTTTAPTYRPTTRAPSAMPTTDAPTAGPTTPPDPTCSTGQTNFVKSLCCLSVCTRCTGSGCSQPPGSAAGCCGTNILNSGVSCADTGPPCIIPPPTGAPTAAPTTGAPTAAPAAPTAAPTTGAPTAAPSTAAPTAAPTTGAPTAAPTGATDAPARSCCSRLEGREARILRLNPGDLLLRWLGDRGSSRRAATQTHDAAVDLFLPPGSTDPGGYLFGADFYLLGDPEPAHCLGSGLNITVTCVGTPSCAVYAFVYHQPPFSSATNGGIPLLANAGWQARGRCAPRFGNETGTCPMLGLRYSLAENGSVPIEQASGTDLQYFVVAVVARKDCAENALNSERACTAVPAEGTATTCMWDSDAGECSDDWCPPLVSGSGGTSGTSGVGGVGSSGGAGGGPAQCPVDLNCGAA